jgi:hypothetical protein
VEENQGVTSGAPEERKMFIPMVKELSKVRDERDRTGELICAAHVQHVIDTLVSRGVNAG